MTATTNGTKEPTASKTIGDLIHSFADKHILLFGDSIVDVYVYGHALGISSETPTIVAHRDRQQVSLGGAFLVARNLLELGAHVMFVTLVGDDDEADWVLNFEHPNLDLLAFCQPGRRTTVKKRYWIDGQKLLQFDEMDNRAISKELELEILLHPRIAQYKSDALVISDYRHGLMTRSMAGNLLHCGRGPVYVDSQISQSKGNHIQYHGADVFTLNRREAEDLYDGRFEYGSYQLGLVDICRQLGTDHLVVKLGEQGCVYSEGLLEVHGLKVSTVDTCGAGDAFLAALCLCDLQNQPKESLVIANIWAALSTEVHGTEPPKKERLFDYLPNDLLNQEQLRRMIP